MGRRKKNSDNDILDNYNKDEINYFNDLTLKEQEKIIKLEKDTDNNNKSTIPLRFKFLSLDTTVNNKKVIINKLNELQKISIFSGEYSKLYKMINTISQIPFGKYHNIEFKSISDYLLTINKELDNKIYGHKETKNQIIRILAQFIVNPNAKGYIIGIQGSMGVGKTKLIKDGIAKVLGFPFSFIPLGGISDASYLKGHLYTYEGSTYGKIIDEIIKAKVMNPIFFF